MNQNREPQIQRSYHIPLSLFQKAFITFQKKFVFPKNWILSAILAAVAVIYVDAAIKDPSNYLSYLLIVICIAMICVLWYNPRKLRRSLFESMKELEQDVYHLCVYEDGLTIATEDQPDSAVEGKDQSEEESVEWNEENIPSESDQNGFRQLFDEENQPNAPVGIEPTVIPFEKGVKILEYADFFMVYLVKRMFYVIPKSEFSEDEQIRLRILFTDRLAESFVPMKESEA